MFMVQLGNNYGQYNYILSIVCGCWYVEVTNSKSAMDKWLLDYRVFHSRNETMTEYQQQVLKLAGRYGMVYFSTTGTTKSEAAKIIKPMQVSKADTMSLIHTGFFYHSHFCHLFHIHPFLGLTKAIIIQPNW